MLGYIVSALRMTLKGLLALGAAFLALSILYIVVTPPSTIMLGRWATLQPVERTVVPLERISPHLQLMVVASEDGQFCAHRGVDWSELAFVLERGESRGASTIPMQTAKNLFLWPQRSYVRKALEIPIAIWIDLVWSKRRMLEIYLNVAEWDEGVFGAEAAARHYFNKSAADLTRREAALLATALPAPKSRNPRAPSAGHARLADRLAARGARSGWIVACLR
ncbi:MAG: monofunctional biosynthetic peptidoglycan transglycosylase [Salinarimonadaceae bacterium]|nr:MAG: monofunctional biosynthetic peptidoglycan transglycosylase [Salinarimonadaceae bacterium]